MSGPQPIEGVITAMVTPFDANGELDLDATRDVARHLAETGSHGVVVAGTTGESPTLSDAERLRLLETTLDEIGDRLIVICGTGSNDTRHSVRATRDAVSAGAHGVLAVTPYYNKPNPEGLRAHFAAVAEAAGEVPVILYNIPSRSVINMPVELMARMAADNGNIVAVKQANNDELGPIDGLQVLAGNDDIFLRTLELGGPGGILVASHVVGTEMRAMYEAFNAGDTRRAHEIDLELQTMYEALSVTSNPIPVKAALEMLGVLESGELRLPMVQADQAQRGIVRTALEAKGLLVAGGTG